jgi:hypothetical protein
MTKRNGLELTTGVITLILGVASLVLFLLSYTTGYYTFGQMQSPIIAALLGTGMAVEIAALIIRRKNPSALWPKLLTFCVTALLSGASMLLIGDRVEGIGYCIVTDYDSGHGGEEAIYMSIAASILMLTAVIYNIIGSFAQDFAASEAASKSLGIARWTGFGVSALVVLLAVLLPTANLVKDNGTASANDPSDTSTTQTGGSYKISYNMNDGTADTMPGYQFLCSDFKGLVQADSRFYVDVTLTLDENGNYTLFSDAYVVESGKRCEIGDDTGLGMVLTMTAEGAYTENSDGTYTTSIPAHAVFEMQMDTYSSQMKEAFGMSVDGSTEDGIYDSSEVPAILDFIPETIWNLTDGSITSWANAADGETGNESSNGDEAAEGGTNGEDSTNGLIFPSDDGATTFTFHADGTYRFAFESYNVEDLGTYSYDGSTLTITNSNGAEITATGDPLKFHYVSAISEQLTGDFTIPTADLQQ